jgi:GT2 family glycosyltransferase
VKTLAVIMPRYAQDEETDTLTYHCIQAVLDNPDPRFHTTLTVVDDGSQIPMKPIENVRLIEHGINRGIAVGWNNGWKANPEADFYCWLNADCEVTPGWSFPLVAAAEQLDCIAMPYTNGKKAWSMGFVGWCFLASKSTANRIGYFDETFVPAQYEDTDWFHRAIYEHHVPIVNLPASNVLHDRKHGGTQFVPRFQWLHLANRYRYAWKHNVDPEHAPPMYKTPLPDVDLEDI